MIAAGDVTPATAGLTVVVAVSGADVGTAITDAAGHFTVPFSATRGGTVVARLAASPSASPAVALTVSPLVTLRIRSAVAFRGATIDSASSRPRGRARCSRARRSAPRAPARGRVKKGRGRVVVPAPALGRMRVVVEVPALGPYAATTSKRSFKATGRRLAAGSSGADVRVLLHGLEKLGFHTPGISSTLSQPGHRRDRRVPEGLPAAAHLRVRRRRLARFAKARRIRPRSRTPALHIEIDKTRQILLVVRKGRVVHILPTSTGATGNTPEGHWKIRWKAPSTTTWLGSAILFRTMTFKGNEFAIHGFSPCRRTPPATAARASRCGLRTGSTGSRRSAKPSSSTGRIPRLR